MCHFLPRCNRITAWIMHYISLFLLVSTSRFSSPLFFFFFENLLGTVSGSNNGAKVRLLCWNNETTVPQPLSLKQTCLSRREIQLAVDRICLRHTASLSEPLIAKLRWLTSCQCTWTFTQNLVCYLAEICLLVTQFYRGVFVLLERIAGANKGTVSNNSYSTDC